jgi:gamma-F420-2:alpha-L-glutamate ligase
LEATRVLNLDIAGVDLLFVGEDQFSICEVNSAPQFKGFESIGTTDIAEQILRYIKVRLGN